MPMDSATEIAIGINSRIVAVLDISWVKIAIVMNSTVVTINGLGFSPNNFRIKEATTSPTPLFWSPVESADREPIKKAQFLQRDT